MGRWRIKEAMRYVRTVIYEVEAATEDEALDTYMDTEPIYESDEEYSDTDAVSIKQLGVDGTWRLL